MEIVFFFLTYANEYLYLIWAGPLNIKLHFQNDSDNDKALLLPIPLFVKGTLHEKEINIKGHKKT